MFPHVVVHISIQTQRFINNVCIESVVNMFYYHKYVFIQKTFGDNTYQHLSKDNVHIFIQTTMVTSPHLVIPWRQQ